MVTGGVQFMSDTVDRNWHVVSDAWRGFSVTGVSLCRFSVAPSHNEQQDTH